MKILIVGENSRLTKSLVNVSKNQLIVVKKKIYEEWFNDSLLISFLKSINFSNNDSIIVTKSIINPNHNYDEIIKWNFLFQKNIIEILERYYYKTNIYFTGSIFENTLIRNNYLDSKRNLSNYILKNNFLHVKPIEVRLHTLYGVGFPPPNMFLGQIYSSLKNKTEFYMSDGNQVRQYHHYDEVARFLLNMVQDSNINAKIIDFTGKEWVKLKDLAYSIYENFNCLELLNIGALKKASNEIINTENRFIDKGDFKFKAPLIHINKYFEKLLNE